MLTSRRVMESLTLVCVILCFCLTRGEHPPGHKLPLGSHTTPESIDEIPKFSHPKVFFNKYIKDGKPVLIKGGLKTSDDKIFKQWDDAYLREKFGATMVDAEAGRKEDRNKGMETMMLRKFLDVYKDADIYLVQDLSQDMMADLSVPYSLRCGGLQKMLSKVVMWFSGGGTKSVLHMDEFDNINCLLDGTKDLVFFDKEYGPDIEADYFVVDGSYSSVDVESVDMYKYPKFQHLPVFKAKMEPGDCLFIPYRWYHQVNSYGSRNLAINFWFHHRFWFNDTECPADDSWSSHHRLSDFILKDDEKLRDLIVDSLYLEGDSITKEDFLDVWRDMISVSAPDNERLFDYIDMNSDSILTWDELYAFRVDDVYAKFPKAFGNDFREQYREMKAQINAFSSPETASEHVKEEL